ncbi:MAG TPA: polysaccharide pyruvyl transferase family protein [Acidimicrobiales bacterium]|jgi:polysaccharide pyruvyl transferase WcaK-like protein
MPAALLTGAFGQGNLGDDALLQAFVNALPGWNLTVTCDDPAKVEELGCLPVPSNRHWAIARAALRADAVIVGGGTVFKTLHSTTGRRPHALLANTSALIAVSSATSCPIALIGVGAGALSDRLGRALAVFTSRHADLLILRDEESAGELIRAGSTGPLRVGADPTWTLVGSPQARTAHESSIRIVPSIYAVGVDGWKGMISRICNTVTELLAAGHTVQLQAWEEHPQRAKIDDKLIVDTVASQFGGSVDVVPKPESFEAAIRSMAGIGAVVCFRFHALLAAAAAGVPAVAISHENKLNAIARRLEQRIAPLYFDPGSLVGQVADAVRASGPAPSVIKEQIELADEGFRLLRVLLSNGDSDEADGMGALPLVSVPPAS